MATEELDVDLAARENLRKLGYTQEVSRRPCRVTVCYTFSSFIRGSPLLSNQTLPYRSVAYATSLVGGGPAVMVWGCLLVSAVTQALALSFAEICSKFPTSAGGYYWYFHLALPRYKVLLCVWTIALSVTFGIGAKPPNSSSPGLVFFRPDWVTILSLTDMFIFLGVTAVALVFCLFFNKYLPTIDILLARWTTLGIIDKNPMENKISVILICLLLSVKAVAERRPVSFTLGGGFDAAAASESGMDGEVRGPSKILPRTIARQSVPIGAIWGVPFLLPITLAAPSGQPIGVMFTLVMGSNGGGFGLVRKRFGVGLFCAIISISCAASRATWAFACDKAIPLHGHFSKIGPPTSVTYLSTPLSSPRLCIQVLTYLGSTAINAFVGVAVISALQSRSPTGRRDVRDAPCSLGRARNVVNGIAVLWILFAIALFSMGPM
ncbi:amino acid transporter [Pisolithus microcarpus]|nr:amino acid transporter [Pisolithus microcarpus]